MRIDKRLKTLAFCLTIIFILLANVSNAYQELNFRPSSSKDIIIWLNAKNIRKEGDKSKADVVLVNNKGTWVYVKQDFSEGKFPVPTEGAYLIGPNYIKNLGTKEFTKGSFIKFNAETAIGVGHRLGSPESNMLLGALAIDLAMRGFFSKELSPNAFDRPLVLPIEVGMASIDPLFYTITSHCSGPLGVFSKAVIMKDADKAIEALGKFLICTTEAPVREKIKEWLIKLFSKEVAEKWARIFVGNIGDFVNVPLKATLIELITKNTFAAPPEGWARIEAVEAVNRLQIISSLRILEPPPYKVGQTITSEFSIKNAGTVPITLDVLTVGGRHNNECPQDVCPDFEWKEKITLRPGVFYPYKGKLKLEVPGNYHFFTAYRTKGGWNTVIPTVPGVKNTVDITVPLATNITGKWIPENLEKIEGEVIRSLEFREDGILLTTEISIGNWRIDGPSEINFYNKPIGGQPSTPPIKGQIKEDAIYSPVEWGWGMFFRKQKDAYVIKETTKGKVWSGYIAEGWSVKGVLKLRKDGAFHYTLYLNLAYECETDGKVIKTYIDGYESWWTYEIEGEKIKEKLKTNPHEFIAYVRETPQLKTSVTQLQVPVLHFPLSGNLDDRIKERRIKGYFNFGADWKHGKCGGLWKKHIGIDWPAEPEENVYATERGEVEDIGVVQSGKNWAKRIVINHTNFSITFVTIYEHVNPDTELENKYKQAKKTGQKVHVEKGQKIATIADISPEPDHLHFGIRISPYDEVLSKRGALPQRSGTESQTCQTDPLFPENFINPEDPEKVSYEPSIKDRQH